ncbi:MAG: peptidoglycan DD-metalloendopeptidase family protein [Cyanobacteria bacterium P01_A01_bin.37]
MSTGDGLALNEMQDASRKPIAALGLALSVAASGLVFHQHDDRALGAELPVGQDEAFSFQSGLDLSENNLNSLGVSQPLAIAQAPQTGAMTALTQEMIHIVREGDTLWSISRRYGVSKVELSELNDLSDDHILRIGRRLNIPSHGQVSHRVSTPVISSDTAEVDRNLAQIQIRTITVDSISQLKEPDDSLQSETDLDRSISTAQQSVNQLRIQREQLRASLFNIRSEALTETPSLTEIDDSKSSAKIVRSLSLNSEGLRNWSDPELSPAGDTPSSSNVNSESSVYQIERGDTLAAIARRHGVPLNSIVEANSISNPNRVFVGQTIRIPSSSSSSEANLQEEQANTPVVVRSPNLVEETLVGALPPDRFGVSDGFPLFRSAPVMPLPIPSSIDSSSSPSDEVTNPDEVVNSEVQDSTLEDSDISESSESSSDVYVENLIDDIEEISQPIPSANRQAVLDELEQISQDVALRHSIRPDQAYIEREDAINPEFGADITQVNITDDIPTSENEPAQDEDAALVAVANLGSENYSPHAQPITGRIVSPDLPPLPGAENFIPTGEATFNGYLWPARGTLTSGYGWRWGRMHQGIDIAAPVGTPIYAAAPGVIEFSGWNSGGYGNMVDIRHPDGSKTRYAHNSRNLVRVGQSVAQGHQIAEMGSTGYSTGPHVHFEIHHAGRGAVNPVALLPSR